jgi:hypothetical protein
VAEKGAKGPILREICSPPKCTPKIGANIGAITGILLTGEQNLINRIQSDPVLVSTFIDLVQKSFAAEVKDIEFLDTFLSFNSWVSKMIFKNLPNLYTAITKSKEKVGSKCRVDDDTNSGTKKKTKQRSNKNMLAQEAICGKNLMKYAAATVESSTTTSSCATTRTARATTSHTCNKRERMEYPWTKLSCTW